MPANTQAAPALQARAAAFYDYALAPTYASAFALCRHHVVADLAFQFEQAVADHVAEASPCS